jgi:hypothetical protein
MSLHGMMPSIWGPLAWSCIHALAAEYDKRYMPSVVEPANRLKLTRQQKVRLSNQVSRLNGEIVTLQWFNLLAWVLPCRPCRDSYSAFILEQTGLPHGAQAFAVELHNRVNAKLDKPVQADVMAVRRRLAVWGTETLAHDLFALLFIMALNYNANTEPDKLRHYRDFLTTLANVLALIGMDELAAAVEDTVGFTSQMSLCSRLYEGYLGIPACRAGGPPETLEMLCDRYDLCRS